MRLASLVLGLEQASIIIPSGRFHVRYPASVVGTSGRKAVLHNALKRVIATPLFREKGADGKPGKVLPPSEWEDKHEVALVSTMLSLAKGIGDLAVTARKARFWPFEGQLAKGVKFAKTPYTTHTWFPIVEVEETVKKTIKGKEVSHTIKLRGPTSKLQLSFERDSFKFPP